MVEGIESWCGSEDCPDSGAFGVLPYLSFFASSAIFLSHCNHMYARYIRSLFCIVQYGMAPRHNVFDYDFRVNITFGSSWKSSVS